MRTFLHFPYSSLFARFGGWKHQPCLLRLGAGIGGPPGWAPPWWLLAKVWWLLWRYGRRKPGTALSWFPTGLGMSWRVHPTENMGPKPMGPKSSWTPFACPKGGLSSLEGWWHGFCTVENFILPTGYWFLASQVSSSRMSTRKFRTVGSRMWLQCLGDCWAQSILLINIYSVIGQVHVHGLSWTLLRR